MGFIGQYTQLRRSGGNHMGLCPFPDHVEKTPSFSVSETKQVYFCFGCKKSGNIFSFVEQYLGMGFKESIEFLAKRAHIPLPELGNSSPRVRSNRELYFKLNRFASLYFQDQLKQSGGAKARNYLEKRGLSPAVIETFQLGFAPDSWQGLTDCLTQQATAPVLILVGALMFRNVVQIEMKRLEDFIPSFVTVILIPLTFSITQGILCGLLCHLILMLLFGRRRELYPLSYVFGLIAIVLLYLEHH